MIYEIIKMDSGNEIIKATSSDGKILWIPMDEANSDYQQYLNPTEHLQTRVPGAQEL